jgi:hypothetical protein
MGWQVRVPRNVSAGLGGCGLSRANILRVLSVIHHDLPREADFYRTARLQEDDRLFGYPIQIFDGGRWHRLDLSVDDTTAQGFLLIAALTHEVEPDNPPAQ